MTIPEAIAFIRRYNRWRRGDESIKQPSPRDIGMALDLLCDAAEEGEEHRKDYECLARELNGHDATECLENLRQLKKSKSG